MHISGSITTMRCKSKFQVIKYNIILVIIIILMFSIIGCAKTSSVIFCKSVDKDLNAIGQSDTFPQGEVTAKLEVSKTFGVDKIKITLYKIDGATEEIIDTSEENVSADWDVVAFPITFNETGKYRVEFTSKGTEKLGSGTVNIE